MKKILSLLLTTLLLYQPLSGIENVSGATNSSPEIKITTPDDQVIQPKSQNFIITGKAWDADGEDITVNAEIKRYYKNSHYYNAPVTEPASTNFSLSWGWNELAENTYESIEILVTDTLDSNGTVILPHQLIVDKSNPPGTRLLQQ